MPHTLRMVSVGIDRYKYYPDAKLDFASRDAREIANTFSECTDLSLETQSPYVLTDSTATRYNIRTAVGSIFRSRSSDNHSVAIFYFAGHGIATKEPPGFYLCCHDINTTDVEVGSIRMEEIYHWLGNSSAEYAVAIIDACFSGGLLIEPIGPKMAAKAAYRNMKLLEHPGGKAIALYASCRSDQQARESRDLGHGFYTYHILQGLRTDQAADRDGHITLEGLFTHVAKQFQGDEQQPQSSIREGQPLILKSVPLQPSGTLPIREKVSGSQLAPVLTLSGGVTNFPSVSPGTMESLSSFTRPASPVLSAGVLESPVLPPLPKEEKGWEKLKSMRSLIVLLVLLIIVLVIGSMFSLYLFRLMH